MIIVQRRINMAKRNKKYNPLKSAQMINERILRDSVVAYTTASEDDQQIDLVDLNGDKKFVNRRIADMVSKFRYKWSIMLAVFFKEKGVAKCRFELKVFTQPYFQHELVDCLNDEHKAFTQKQIDKNVNITGLGWLASPVGRDFSEEESGLIFEKMGAL